MPNGPAKFHVLFLMFVALMFFVSLMFLFGYHCWLVAKNRSTLGEDLHVYQRIPKILLTKLLAAPLDCGHFVKVESTSYILIIFPLSRGLLSSSFCQWTRQKWLQRRHTQKPAAGIWRGSETLVCAGFHKVSFRSRGLKLGCIINR